MTKYVGRPHSSISRNPPAPHKYGVFCRGLLVMVTNDKTSANAKVAYVSPFGPAFKVERGYAAKKANASID